MTALSAGIIRFRQDKLGRQVARYSRGLQKSTLDPEVQARAVNGFAEAQRAQNQLVTLAYRVSDGLGKLTPAHRFTLCQYARSIYAAHRRECPELLEMRVAELAGKYVVRGLDRETVLAVLKACWMQLTGRTCPDGLVTEAGRAADALTAAQRRNSPLPPATDGPQSVA